MAAIPQGRLSGKSVEETAAGCQQGASSSDFHLKGNGGIVNSKNNRKNCQSHGDSQADNKKTGSNNFKQYKSDDQQSKTNNDCQAKTSGKAGEENYNNSETKPTGDDNKDYRREK